MTFKNCISHFYCVVAMFLHFLLLSLSLIDTSMMVHPGLKWQKKTFWRVFIVCHFMESNRMIFMTRRVQVLRNRGASCFEVAACYHELVEMLKKNKKQVLIKLCLLLLILLSGLSEEEALSRTLLGIQHFSALSLRVVTSCFIRNCERRYSDHRFRGVLCPSRRSV